MAKKKNTENHSRRAERIRLTEKIIEKQRKKQAEERELMQKY